MAKSPRAVEDFAAANGEVLPAAESFEYAAAAVRIGVCPIAAGCEVDRTVTGPITVRRRSSGVVYGGCFG